MVEATLKAPTLRFRRDIEGLRSVAVLLVVFSHLRVPGFRGGFIGVDVFFVISGYLITSLLAAEYAEKAASSGRGAGTISIGRFYFRRARRILPAALVVLLAVYLGGRFLLNPLRADQINHDELWALFFASNINFIHQATDYFSQGLAISPVQHYWSLAVEEQFYLVWPALFLVATLWHGFRVGGKVVRWNVRVGFAVGVLGLASLAWSIHETAAAPASAYFSTFCRAWELALGAAIAIATSGKSAIPHRLAVSASVIGACLLALGGVFINAGTPFPGYAALLPTVGAGLLILGGIAQRAPLPNRMLGIRPLRFIGRISYSIYLWHWPLIVFAAALYPTTSRTPAARLGLAGLVLVVSTASFHLIEQPGRRLSFGRVTRAVSVWEARRERRRYRDRTARRRVLSQLGWVTSMVLVACLAGAAIAYFDGSRSPAEARAAPLRTANSASVPGVVPSRSRNPRTARARSVHTPTRQPPKAGGAEMFTSWQDKVQTGLTVRTLPSNLQPLQSHLNWYDACMDYRLAIVEHEAECTLGNPRAPQVAAITGDSHAAMWVPTVEGALGRDIWRLKLFVRAGCGWSAPISSDYSKQHNDCPALTAQTLGELRKHHVDLLVVAQGGADSVSNMVDTLNQFKGVAKHLVVLGQTPALPSFADCLQGDSDISRCTGKVDDLALAYDAQESNAAESASATYIDARQWLCFEDRCPSIIDNAPTFADGGHISSEMALKLIPLLRASLQTAGIPVGAR